MVFEIIYNRKLDNNSCTCHQHGRIWLPIQYSKAQNAYLPALLPTSTINSNELQIELPVLQSEHNDSESIARLILFNTNIPERPRYVEVDHEVERGESIFGIASEFEITPETLLWANYDALKDSPDSIRVGMVLRIPPTNGVYYQWQEGDTLAFGF